MKLLFGIAAIGTEQGHCYLIDLRLDDEGEEFDEWRTSPIEVVNPSPHDMAQLRNTARTNGTHLAVEIGSMFKCKTFTFIFYASYFQFILSILMCLPNFFCVYRLSSLCQEIGNFSTLQKY